MSFCREYCLLAVFGVRVRFWLFRGLAACFTVVCLFYAAVCALCAWFRWFTSFICHFIVVWRSPALRLFFSCFKSVLFVLFIEFCVSWRLVLRNMSFFAVDCSFFLYALRVACLFFALLAVGSRVLTLFLPCLKQN